MQKCISSGIMLGLICPSEREGRNLSFQSCFTLNDAFVFSIFCSPLCTYSWYNYLEGGHHYLYVEIPDGNSVFFFPGGPLCRFLRAALYPAEVSGGTKLYLLPWALLDSSDLFLSVPIFCPEQLTFTILPVGM